jgi:hypothetical protein
MIYATGEAEFDRGFEIEIPGFALTDRQCSVAMDSKEGTPSIRAKDLPLTERNSHGRGSMNSGMGSHGVTSKQVEVVKIDGTLKPYNRNNIYMATKSTFRTPIGHRKIQEQSLWVKVAKKSVMKTESTIGPGPGF